ncbi:MAG: glycerol-3-phosphate 1-O-acyltransferase PlsY [Deltaproteobacteria bacterium]
MDTFALPDGVAPSHVALFLGVAYLLGAIPFGLVLARVFKGIDVREHGSKNIGATNVARTAGKPLGILTLALDAAKGAAPVVFAHQQSWGWLAAAGGLVAVLGHVFPVYLKFRGGKGVATAAGVFAALSPVPTAIALGVFVLVVAPFRVVSAGSLAASVALVGATVALDEPKPIVGLAGVVAVVIFVRHRGNIRRLVFGQENRVD